MDIKPFVKRILTQYREGNKQPYSREPFCEVEGGVYSSTILEVKKASVGKTFWDGMSPNMYRATFKNGQMLRVRKYEDTERILIGIYTPNVNDTSKETRPEIQ